MNLTDSDLPGFKNFLRDRGAEILTPTNEYEVLRIRTGEGVQIAYRNARGRTTHVDDELVQAWRAWKNGRSWRASEAPKRRSISVKERTVRERDGDACFYCHAELPVGEGTLEHLLSRTHGGTNHIANLALACEDCNREAGNRSVTEKVRMREENRREWQAHREADGE